MALNLPRLGGLPITGISDRTPVVLQCPAHGRKTGEKIVVQNYRGSLQLNNSADHQSWTVTKVDGNHLSLDGSLGSGNPGRNDPYVDGGTLIAAITSNGFNPQTGFTECDGHDQRIVLDTPDILIYQTDYTIRMLA